MASPAPSPTLQFTTRSKGGLQTFLGSPPDIAKNARLSSNDNVRVFEYSQNGSLLAVINPANVVIYNTNTGDIHKTIPRPQVQAISLSPEGNYLVTYERFDEKAVENKENLIVWSLDDLSHVLAQTQKYFNLDNWPIIKWSNDENYFGKTGANVINLFSPKRPKETVRKIELNNVMYFEFAPKGPPYSLAAYVPEKKSLPASLRLFSVPLFQAPTEPRVIATKSFHKSTSAKIYWNSEGTAALVSTATEVDESNKSYYGETGLFLVSTDGTTANVVLRQKTGPVHDVAWAPNGNEFIVTYGYMPAQSTLFDKQCNPILDFGEAPRNTIRWAPNGKLVCIGGFGNLQGQMDFWNIKEAKKVGAAEAHCAAVCEWAPDSRHLIAAVVSPRMRVDNGYKIFRYDGGLVYQEEENELYQVAWRPFPHALFPERPLSPLRAAPSSTSSSAPATVAPAKYQHPNAGKYQHPNAAASSPTTKREEPEIRFYGKPRVSKPEDSLPPGWVADEPAAKKPAQQAPKKTPFVPLGGMSPSSKNKNQKKGGGKGQSLTSVFANDKPSTKKTTTTTTTTTTTLTIESDQNTVEITESEIDITTTTTTSTILAEGTTQIDETNNNKSNNNNKNNKKKRKGKQKETGEVAEPTGEEAPGSTDVQETDEAKVATSPKPLDENQKKAKAISKKLSQIEKLKQKQAEGIKLTPDEAKKVATEAELRKEVNALKSKK